MTEPADPRPVPTPWVTVAGVSVTTAGTSGTLVAVDALTITWGRSSVLAQPSPATARVVLFDPSKRWALDRDLIGADFRAGYSIAGEPSVRTFRGRVQTAAVRPHIVQTTAGPVHGSLIELEASSVLVDLANRRPTAAWPQETVQARANRIAGLVPAILGGGIYFRTAVGGRTVNAVAADKQVPLLEHLDRLADAAGGDRLIHDPSMDQLHYIARRRYPGIRNRARLRWEYDEAGGPAGRGALLGGTAEAMPDAWEPTIGIQYWLPGYACQVDDAALTMDASSRLSTIQVEYWDSTAAAARRVEVAVPGTDEATEGVRSLAVTTDLVGSSPATSCANELATLASQEGARWAPPRFTYRPQLAGGWPDLAHVHVLLRAWEQEAVLAIGGTFLSPYRLLPVFGVMGGVVSYAAGQWQVTCEPAPIAPPDVKQHPITWEETGPDTAGRHVLLYDTPHQQGLHPSLTLDDLKYAGMGVGDPYAYPGPDTGWDAL